MYSLKFSIILGLLLAIPFLLRLKHIEPYPALLLPEGASNFAYTNRDAGISYTILYGKTASGEWKAIDPPTFAAPIPVQYFPQLLIKLIQTDTLKNVNPRDKILQSLHLTDRYKITPDDRKEMYKWLQQRLTNEGLGSSVVKVVYYTESILASKTKQVSKTTDNEQIITLSE